MFFVRKLLLKPHLFLVTCGWSLSNTAILMDRYELNCWITFAYTEFYFYRCFPDNLFDKSKICGFYLVQNCTNKSGSVQSRTPKWQESLKLGNHGRAVSSVLACVCALCHRWYSLVPSVL